MQSIGGPAAAKVVRAGVHPVKIAKGGPASETLARLQESLKSPPPWLARIMGVEAASLAPFRELVEAVEDMIQAALLDDVLTQVARQAASHPRSTRGAGAPDCARAFPGVHITVCGDDDIPPRLPAAAGNDVCQTVLRRRRRALPDLTSDAEAASGIVVALRGDDD